AAFTRRAAGLWATLNSSARAQHAVAGEPGAEGWIADGPANRACTIRRLAYGTGNAARLRIGLRSPLASPAGREPGEQRATEDDGNRNDHDRGDPQHFERTVATIRRDAEPLFDEVQC